jgi:hypothetical protein
MQYLCMHCLDFFIVFILYLYTPKTGKGLHFSIPRLNQQETLHRYQWTVLTQGMTNSPLRVSIL